MSAAEVAGRLPQINPRLVELDSMRQRTQRIRSDFLSRNGAGADAGRRLAAATTRPTDVSPQQAISQRHSRFLKPSHIQHPDPCLQDRKYYTEVTLRPEPAEYQFNALNRSFVPPPEWNSPRPASSLYALTDVADWEAQIVKKPPPQQSYSQPMRVRTPLLHNSGEDWNATTGTMFRPVDRFQIPAREYKINREWVSEDERICRARAERLMRSRVK